MVPDEQKKTNSKPHSSHLNPAHFLVFPHKFSATKHAFHQIKIRKRKKKKNTFNRVQITELRVRIELWKSTLGFSHFDIYRWTKEINDNNNCKIAEEEWCVTATHRPSSSVFNICLLDLVGGRLELVKATQHLSKSDAPPSHFPICQSFSFFLFPFYYNIIL